MSPTPTPKRTVASPDRRHNTRFRISVPVKYTTGRLRGEGVTRDVSNGGVFIKTDRVLPIGQSVKLLIDWPSKFDTGRALCFVLSGKILRSTTTGTAVVIVRHRCQVLSGSLGSAPAVRQAPHRLARRQTGPNRSVIGSIESGRRRETSSGT